MSMILPYHDIASAAALAEVGVCNARPVARPAGLDTPVFFSACGMSATPVHKPSRWARLVGAVLSPISGPSLAPPRTGASNI